jgi:hypothetical protein
VRVLVRDLLLVIEPWAQRHGYRVHAVHIEDDERARVEIDVSGKRLALEAYALDAFGNVGVDLDAGGVRHAYTGPLPDLHRMLEEAREQIDEVPAPRGSDLN